jgi:hypothetical protein
VASDLPLDKQCPPHHWLIEETGDGRQSWTCHRCGAAKDQDAAPEQFKPQWGNQHPPAPSSRTSSGPRFPRPL